MPDEIIDIVTVNNSLIRNIFIYMKNIFLDLFMAFGPTLNYLFQTHKFKKTKSSKGFSNFLCLVTILSHTLKVFFWFGKKFKYILLIQSILVIFMQLYMIYLVIKYKENTDNDSNIILINNISKNKKIRKIIFKFLFDWSETLKWSLIWRWNNVIEYYKFYFLIIFILSLFSYKLGFNNIYYINIIGGVSIFLEMLCSLPQIIELQKTKNQKNISKMMVFMWFTGNILKIYYNASNNSPIQLIIGSYVQVFFNCILIYQIFYYYQKNKLEPINTIRTGEIRFVDSKEEKQKEEDIEIEEEHLINDQKQNNKIDYLKL